MIWDIFFPLCDLFFSLSWHMDKIKIIRVEVNKHCHAHLFNSPGHGLIINWDKRWPYPREMESECETGIKRDNLNNIEGLHLRI